MFFDRIFLIASSHSKVTEGPVMMEILYRHHPDVSIFPIMQHYRMHFFQQSVIVDAHWTF